MIYFIAFLLQLVIVGASIQRKSNDSQIPQERLSRRIGRELQDDYRGVKKKRSKSSYDYLQGSKYNSAYYNSDSNPWEVDTKTKIFMIFPCCALLALTFSCWKRGCRILGCEMKCCVKCCNRIKRRRDPSDQK